MRRIVILPVVLSLALVPAAAAAQFDHGGFVVAGRGGGRTALLAPRFSVEGGYTMEAGGRHGPYVGGRYSFGIHEFGADEQGLRDRYGNGAGTVSGGGGTLYDTGADVEVGYGVGVLRVYGFTGIHYYQQFHDPAKVTSGGEEDEVIIRSRSTLANGRGAGVQLRLTGTGAVVAEWYRGAGDDGVMRLSGTRFGLRWVF